MGNGPPTFIRRVGTWNPIRKEQETTKERRRLAANF
jgi:hypothetical protein